MLNRYGHLSPSKTGRGTPGTLVASSARVRLSSATALLLLLAALAAGAGCAAPAPPRPSNEQVPNPVADLRVHQSGMIVFLHFTLPQHSTDGKRIGGPQRVEIYREFVAAAPSAPAAAAGAESKPGVAAPVSPGPPVYTLDVQGLAKDRLGDTVTFPDTLTKTEFEAHRGGRVTYRVRTAAGKGGWSDLSGAASVTLVLPPAPVSGLTAEASAEAVTLRWTPPAPGAPQMPQSFAIYRVRLNRGVAAEAAEAVGVTTGTSYRDTSVGPGQSYRYTVRGMTPAPAGEVESADSTPVVVDVPAPARLAPPEGVAAILVRQPSESVEVDISWAISGERNLAGYNVYRSERPGERGVRLNRQQLASATFRDTTVVPGRSYEYSVTSVDLAGSESSPSKPVRVTVPAPGGGSR